MNDRFVKKFQEEYKYRKVTVGKYTYHMYFDGQSIGNTDIECTYQFKEKRNYHIYMNNKLFESVFPEDESLKYLRTCFKSKLSRITIILAVVVTFIVFNLFKFVPLNIMNINTMPDSFFAQLFILCGVWGLILVPLVLLWYIYIKRLDRIPIISIGNLRHCKDEATRIRYVTYLKETGLSYMPRTSSIYDRDARRKSIVYTFTVLFVILIGVLSFADKYKEYIHSSDKNVFVSTLMYPFLQLEHNNDKNYKIRSSKFEFEQTLDSSFGTIRYIADCENLCMYDNNWTNVILDNSYSASIFTKLPTYIRNVDKGYWYGNVGTESIIVQNILEPNESYLFEDLLGNNLDRFAVSDDYFVGYTYVDDKFMFMKLNKDETVEYIESSEHIQYNSIEIINDNIFAIDFFYDEGERVYTITKYDTDFVVVDSYEIRSSFNAELYFYEGKIYFVSNEVNYTFINDSDYTDYLKYITVLNEDFEQIDRFEFRHTGWGVSFVNGLFVSRGNLEDIVVMDLQGEYLANGFVCEECIDQSTKYRVIPNEDDLLVVDISSNTIYVYESTNNVSRSFTAFEVSSRDSWLSFLGVMSLNGIAFYALVDMREKMRK